MKKVLLFSVLLGMIFVGLNSVDANAQKKSKKYIGQVISLDDVITAKKDKQLTKDQAKALVEQGIPLVFLYNKKVYFVKNEDGSFAFKKLANYAQNKKVVITAATIKTVSGINYMVMSDINSGD